MFKNKKGFTLIELLAVIVILAILMLVAGANVFGILDETRKGSFRTEFLELLNAAQTKAQVDIMNGVIEGTGPNSTRCYSIADLATYFDNKNNYEGSVKVTYTNGQLTIKGFMAGNQHMVNNKDDTLETTDVLAVTETATENINTCALCGRYLNLYPQKFLFNSLLIVLGLLSNASAIFLMDIPNCFSWYTHALSFMVRCL